MTPWAIEHARLVERGALWYVTDKEACRYVLEHAARRRGNEWRRAS